MHTLSMVLAIVGMTALLAQTAGGQPRDPIQRGGADLLRNTQVQKELKLSNEQIKKIKEVSDEVRQRHQEAFSRIGELSQDEGNELRKKVSEETLQSLKDVLKPEQTKRLKQIELHQRGLMAFQDPDVSKALKLTDQQKDKMRSLNEDSVREMRALFQGGDFKEAIKKVTILRKEALEKGVSVLTAEQKKTWQELTGEPFEVKFEGPLIRPRNDPAK